MKNIRILILSLLIAAAGISVNKAKAQVSVSADVTFSVFHDNLQAYGRWENHPTYGQVWVASEPNFVPYRTGGHWVYTDDGWTWVSDYSWGWAPFHYGRWDYDVSYGGYFWVPDYTWGPAWVSWRSDNENYGWAPLRPGVSVGIGISFGSDIPADRWTFVPNRYIASPHVNNYYVDRSRNVTIINKTTIINNVHNNNSRTVVVGGPRREDVQRYTHSTVNTYRVANNSRPGTTINKNTVNIYRPVVNKTTVVNKTVINNNRTVVNNNNKTVVNNNNNKTVVNNRPAANNKPAVNNRPAVNNQHPVVSNKPAENRPAVNNKPVVNNNQHKTQVTNNNTVNARPKTPAARPAVTRPAQPARQVTRPATQPKAAPAPQRQAQPKPVQQHPQVNRPAPRPAQPQHQPARAPERKPDHK